jgi:hypothetical protein
MAVTLPGERLWRTCPWHFGVTHVGFADDALVAKQQTYLIDQDWSPLANYYTTLMWFGMGHGSPAYWQEGHCLWTPEC